MTVREAIEDIEIKFIRGTGIKPTFLIIGEMFFRQLLEEIHSSCPELPYYDGLKIIRVKTEVIEMGY